MSRKIKPIKIKSGVITEDGIKLPTKMWCVICSPRIGYHVKKLEPYAHYNSKSDEWEFKYFYREELFSIILSTHDNEADATENLIKCLKGDFSNVKL